MSHVSDFTKSDKEIITDLLVYDNPGLTLSANLVDYLNPRTLTGTARNTALTVAPKPGSGYEGEADVYYDRLDITDFAYAVIGTTVEVRVGTATRVADLIPAINVLLGISLEEQDYHDAALPTFGDIPNESYQVDIAIKAGSLIYTGVLSFELKANIMMLEELVAITYLPGLQYPDGNTNNPGGP